MKNTFVFVFLILLVFQVAGQRTEMRTRLLPSLTNVEVEEYLKRNDVIFIPVGATEVHGPLPLDCEYVSPLAFAIKMAEKVDGLVLPGLQYFYPGATQIGKGTVHTSCIEGAEYLKTIAHSLLRQGFKTQIYITGHGPSYGFMEPFLFDFLHESQVPILYMNQMNLLSDVTSFGDFTALNKIMFGSYKIVDRLDDIPLSFEGIDLPKDYKTNETMGTPTAAARLQHLNNVQSIQWYYNSPYDHGGVPELITSDEREKWAVEGVQLIDKIIDGMDLDIIVKSLKEHQEYTGDMVKKYGTLLDFNK